MSQLSQNQRILEYLENHKTITALEAQKEFGCMRLAARISDLEDMGYSFIRKTVVAMNMFDEPVRVTSYRLNMR